MVRDPSDTTLYMESQLNLAITSSRKFSWLPSVSPGITPTPTSAAASCPLSEHNFLIHLFLCLPPCPIPARPSLTVHQAVAASLLRQAVLLQAGSGPGCGGRWG